MTRRREFLAAAGSVALGAWLGGTRAARADTAGWPPYADTIAIDGASGVNLVFMEKGDPAIAGELARLAL